MAAAPSGFDPQAVPRARGPRKKFLLLGVAIAVVAAAIGIGVFVMVGGHTDPAAQRARDEAEIETVLRSVLETDDPKKVLDLYSNTLRQRYENANLPPAGIRSDQGKVLFVSNVLIAGDLANADVTVRFPDLAEETTMFYLVKEGGKWRYTR
ncbi:hypothetical protein [Nocardia niigatensis]|uniref:hypothetical protein n=1 Tax=Nocardia niigatensis TaxID=209249 RepID=UPI000595316F|nr:hypothetical protein [Nocardia niigatensis]